MAIRCFVLDDEPLATDLLTDYISRLSDLELIGVSNSPTEALRILQHTPVDVLFLDIQMPGLTGFDLLRPLGYTPRVIFTTAFQEFALESYDFDVLDFLVKPVSFERFLRSVSKIYRLTQAVPSPPEPKEFPEVVKDYQYFRVNKELVKVVLDDILWIESFNDFVRFHTTSGMLISYVRLSYLEERLPADRFVRIHKSFIVAFHHIQAISRTYLRISNQEIPIGRMYKDKLDNLLRQNPSGLL